MGRSLAEIGSLRGDVVCGADKLGWKLPGVSGRAPASTISITVFERFLRRQREEGMALAAASDLLALEAHPLPPPNFLATYRCKGLVRMPDGAIEEASYFQAGIWFPPDYLRRVDPFEILRWFGPSNIWHPNISDRLPL